MRLPLDPYRLPPATTAGAVRDERSMLVLERALAAIAVVAAVLVSLAR